MSKFDDGATMYNHSRGRFTEEEIPSTRTAVDRGKLKARAAKGDEPAKRALHEWAKARDEAILAEARARQAYGDA